MPQDGGSTHGLIATLITVAVIGVILFIRIRRTGKARPLRLERLWIVPAVYAVLMAVVLAEIPPHGAGWLWCALALGVGAAAGWLRGKTMHITVDPETHALDHVQSPAALMFLVALIVVRMASRMYLAESAPSHAATLLATDVLLAFAFGLLSVQRLEMGLRARRLLNEARALRGA